MKGRLKMYKLLADEVEVWSSANRPSQEIVNRVYNKASSLGWNGVTLELFQGNIFIKSCGFVGDDDEYEDPNDYSGMGWVGQDGRP
jgi:hypothetical protein